MKKLKILNRILRVTGMYPLVNGFISFLLLSALLLQIVEPQMTRYIDALWYLFATFTTIGYGDIVAATLLGRIITVIVALYGILVVAFIPAVIIGYYTEFNKAKAKEVSYEYLNKLENLPSLSREELEEISNQIKERRFKL